MLEVLMVLKALVALLQPLYRTPWAFSCGFILSWGLPLCHFISYILTYLAGDDQPLTNQPRASSPQLVSLYEILSEPGWCKHVR